MAGRRYAIEDVLEGLAHTIAVRVSNASPSRAEVEQIEVQLLLIDYDLGLTEKELNGLFSLFAKVD